MKVFLCSNFLNKHDFLLGIVSLWQEMSCLVLPFGFDTSLRCLAWASKSRWKLHQYVKYLAQKLNIALHVSALVVSDYKRYY